MSKVKVSLTEEKETLLATLYGRARDAKQSRPILADAMAAQTVEKLDYDFGRMKIDARVAASVAVRAKYFDSLTAAFLANFDTATVVHMAAGLDTRVWRVAPGPGIEWYDVDYPEVIELRDKLFPVREGYRTIGSSVTEAGWLEAIAPGRPTLVLAEGLTMYLRPEAGHELMRRLSDRFAKGTIAFDAFNRFGIRMQKLNPAVRGSGATLYWGIDDPHELERANPKLRLVESVNALYEPGVAELPLSSRIFAKLVWPFPSLRTMGRYLRYEVI
jgi:O-methyltransferase involved in polyketide biosynthesis